MAITVATGVQEPFGPGALVRRLAAWLRDALGILGRALVILGWSITLGSFAVGVLQTAEFRPAAFASQDRNAAGVLQRALSLTLWDEAVFASRSIETGLEALATGSAAKAAGGPDGALAQWLRQAIADGAAAILARGRDALAAIRARTGALPGLDLLRTVLEHIPVLLLLVPLGVWLRRESAVANNRTPGLTLAG